MMRASVDDFFAMILAICMIAVELMAILVGAPIMGDMPILIVHDGVIHLIPFMTAVTGVLFLFIINLWFAKGFMNVMRNIQYERKALKELEQGLEEEESVEL